MPNGLPDELSVGVAVVDVEPVTVTEPVRVPDRVTVPDSVLVNEIEVLCVGVGVKEEK